MTADERDEVARRDAAFTARGDVVDGAARDVTPRRLGQMVSLRLEADLIVALREVAERRGTSLSSLLREAAALLLAHEQGSAGSYVTSYHVTYQPAAVDFVVAGSAVTGTAGDFLFGEAAVSSTGI